VSDDFINHDVFIALDDDRVVAYGLGNIKQLEKKTSYNEIGEKAFFLDELYVAAEYRNRGIGKALYTFMEEDVKEKVDVISVIATSNEYKKLLNFYIEDLDMKFNHAQLTKRMHE
ncbi:MAG: GNAT family N-acetyltransferase, partial [Erysipelotrichaceae bacterium]|nr:GNAT family N-acetyltransferase [Erysipelotrichaceae bacterium]